jgi:hypothetical protein
VKTVSHKVKTEQVSKNLCHPCGDIYLTAYLPNVVDPVPLVPDLHIDHDRFGSRSDPNLNGHLHYPNDTGRSLNEDVTDKIRKYRSDIIITHLTSSHLCLLLLVRLTGYKVNL